MANEWRHGTIRSEASNDVDVIRQHGDLVHVHV
jgi:hypothetical protein